MILVRQQANRRVEGSRLPGPRALLDQVGNESGVRPGSFVQDSVEESDLAALPSHADARRQARLRRMRRGGSEHERGHPDQGQPDQMQGAREFSPWRFSLICHGALRTVRLRRVGRELRRRDPGQRRPADGTDSVLSANNSNSGGGAIAAEDEDFGLVIENSQITGNTADGDGGVTGTASAVLASGHARSRATPPMATAAGRGSASSGRRRARRSRTPRCPGTRPRAVAAWALDSGGPFTIASSTISGNTADGDGGGLYIDRLRRRPEHHEHHDLGQHCGLGRRHFCGRTRSTATTSTLSAA